MQFDCSLLQHSVQSNVTCYYWLLDALNYIDKQWGFHSIERHVYIEHRILCACCVTHFTMPQRRTQLCAVTQLCVTRCNCRLMHAVNTLTVTCISYQIYVYISVRLVAHCRTINDTVCGVSFSSSIATAGQKVWVVCHPKSINSFCSIFFFCRSMSCVPAGPYRYARHVRHARHSFH